FSNIPIGPVGTLGRVFFATKTLPASITQPSDAAWFFVTDDHGLLLNNVDTTFECTFFENGLIQNALFLQNNLQKIDAGVMLGSFHNRLVVGGAVLDSNQVSQTFPPALIAPIAADPSVLKFSAVGSPELIPSVGGLLDIDISHSISVVDAVGNVQKVGMTASQEYRNVYYVFKLNKSYALVDNGQDPATWNPTVLDEGIGCFPHGITTVLDTGGVNIDSFFIADKTGMYLFSGVIQKPEITWKIADLWSQLVRIWDPTSPYNDTMHFVNDSVRKKIYISAQFPRSAIGGSGVIPEKFPNCILLCDYSNTQTNDSEFYKNIRWAKWVFDTNLFVPMSLLIYDDGNFANFIMFNKNDGIGYLYGGNNLQQEIMLAPFITSSLIGDSEGNIGHYGAVRLIVNGDGDSVLTPTIINRDNTRMNVGVGKVIPPNPGVETTFLLNMLSQRAKIKIQTGDNCSFNINKMVVFIKPTYAGVPG
ncbi:MAG TPA: hypothetical protein VNX68_06900, partial [Nitrosopumilaceae archaeon]|nr:hypothetical protein [Nitrosopumilaceae archaeon]